VGKAIFSLRTPIRPRLPGPLDDPLLPHRFGNDKLAIQLTQQLDFAGLSSKKSRIIPFHSVLFWSYSSVAKGLRNPIIPVKKDFHHLIEEGNHEFNGVGQMRSWKMTKTQSTRQSSGRLKETMIVAPARFSVQMRARIAPAPDSPM